MVCEIWNSFCKVCGRIWKTSSRWFSTTTGWSWRTCRTSTRSTRQARTGRAFEWRPFMVESSSLGWLSRFISLKPSWTPWEILNGQRGWGCLKGLGLQTDPWRRVGLWILSDMRVAKQTWVLFQGLGFRVYSLWFRFSFMWLLGKFEGLGFSICNGSYSVRSDPKLNSKSQTLNLGINYLRL